MAGVLLLGWGCGGSSPVGAGGESVSVAVSILPQRYFVGRIGGSRVRVTVLVGPGESPAVYAPRPSQVKQVSDAAVYFTIGVPFEQAWLPRIRGANPAMRIVDTGSGITRMVMKDGRHSHGPAAGEDRAEGEAGMIDPHIWLSPRLAKVQARAICDTLSMIDPQGEAVYRENLAAFLADIDHLDAELRRRLGPLPRRTFMVFHPSWAYFAREYGLEMIAVEVGGQEPSAAELAHLVQRAKAHRIRAVIAQPEFSTRAAEILAAEIGAEVVRVSPLAERWLENLRTMGAVLERALGDKDERETPNAEQKVTP